MTIKAKKQFIELPLPNKILFAKENIQFGWSKIVQKWHKGKGLHNPSNSCYLNASLQALFHIPSFVHWLLYDEKHRKKGNCTDEDHCIICAMARTLLMTQGDLEHSVSPSLINKRLNDICRNLKPGRQEDAHEFLRHLIDVMNENFLQRHIENLSLDDISKSTTPINQIFGGFLRSTITCTACHNKSESFEQFMELSLDIRNVFTLKDAISSFFSRENLDDMSYDCIKCKKKVTAQKQFHLETSPIVLCVQIKRFDADGEKIRKKIRVELHLDMSRFFSQSANNNQRSYYKLVSLVCHNGNSTASGHFFTLGLAPNGLYYSFDDSLVKEEKIHENIRKSNAYFLFYEVHDLDMSRNSAVRSM